MQSCFNSHAVENFNSGIPHYLASGFNNSSHFEHGHYKCSWVFQRYVGPWAHRQCSLLEQCPYQKNGNFSLFCHSQHGRCTLSYLQEDIQSETYRLPLLQMRNMHLFSNSLSGGRQSPVLQFDSVVYMELMYPLLNLFHKFQRPF